MRVTPFNLLCIGMTFLLTIGKLTDRLRNRDVRRGRRRSGRAGSLAFAFWDVSS